MRTHSIARRVVLLFLLVEVVCALCMTGFVFVYERHTHFHSLDLALRGRADTLMGAVADLEDKDDNVFLDLDGIRLPEDDLYEVRDVDHRLLGRSGRWVPPSALASAPLEPSGLYRTIHVNGVEYRAVRITGLRNVDPNIHEVRHHIVVVYASPTRQAWLPIRRAVEDFALASLLLAVLSGGLVTALVRSSMSPLKELAGEASAISSSQWRFAPAERARRTEELAPLIAALEDLVQRLQVSFAQQRQFVSDSAHELKTAITVVKSSLQLLELRASQPHEYRAGVMVSLNDCQRMEELVGRMLMLARVEEAGRLPGSLEAQSAELHAGVLEAFAALESLARLRGVTLVYQGPEALRAAIAREDWVTVCTNLLLNAVQHSAAGSRVLVKAEPTGTHAVCSFVDDGAGIAPEALPFVFDRFYRGDASRARATGGTGLGLAICKAVVERAAGAVTIESRPGAGTTVRVQLPVRAPGAAWQAQSVAEQASLSVL